MSNEQDRDMAEVIAKIEKAMDEVSALCNGKKWRMCIPAERDSDSDLVIDDALHAAKDALLASSQGQGDGSHKSPFRGSFNPVCLQRHDSDLMVGICERDDAFELIVTPPRTGPQRHYRINSDGSWTDQSQPPDKPEPRGDALEILEAVANYQVQEYAGANYSCLFCGGVDGTHETDCISLKAAALLASSQGQRDEEAACLQLIAERDNAEEMVDTLLDIIGVEHEWSNLYNYNDALDDAKNKLAHSQPDESQGQGELPEVKHLDGAFCDLVVTYSQAEFLLSKATGRKITLGHYIRPQPDGLREACEALIKEWDRVFLRCSSTDVTTFMAAPIERFRATLAQADREAMG